MTSKQVEAVFTIAGVEISKKWRLVNKYYGDLDAPDPSHYPSIVQNPWWLVKIDFGLMITIGWRKRVINIEWDFELADFESLVDNPGDRTICSRHIHAWDLIDASKIVGRLVELWKKQHLYYTVGQSTTQGATEHHASSSTP